jgi:hypothetical protein
LESCLDARWLNPPADIAAKSTTRSDTGCYIRKGRGQVYTGLQLKALRSIGYRLVELLFTSTGWSHPRNISDTAIHKVLAPLIITRFGRRVLAPDNPSQDDFAADKSPIAFTTDLTIWHEIQRLAQ